MDPQEEDLWVERAFRYSITFELSIDPLRQSLPVPVFAKFYEEETEEWKKVQMTDPAMMFIPGDRQAQEILYGNLDAICATLDSVKKDDWKALLRISSAAQTGAWFITVGGNQFPYGSPAFAKIQKRLIAKLKVWCEANVKAHREREAALLPPGMKIQWTDPRTLGLSHGSPGLNLKIDETVTYFHPETNKVLEFVVLGFQRSKQGGIRYAIAYADNDDVEVELNEDEMQAILYERVSAEDLDSEASSSKPCPPSRL